MRRELLKTKQKNKKIRNRASSCTLMLIDRRRHKNDMTLQEAEAEEVVMEIEGEVVDANTISRMEDIRETEDNSNRVVAIIKKEMHPKLCASVVTRWDTLLCIVLTDFSSYKRLMKARQRQHMRLMS